MSPFPVPGLVSLRPAWLLDGSPLAGFVTGFITAYWGPKEVDRIMTYKIMMSRCFMILSVMILCVFLVELRRSPKAR